MLQEPNLDKDARRLLVRSLTQAPAAPQIWPQGGGKSELHLARPEAGLVVYESEPTGVDDTTLGFIGERLVSQYVQLLPHARLGLRVAISGEGAGPLIEGMA